MILCLDLGNTHIFGGLFVDDNLALQCRYPSSVPCTSDQVGIFFKNVLRENDVNPKSIKKIAICSVVPSLNYTIRAAFLKYFDLDPFFLQTADVTELTIAYENPHEIGADRLCNAIGATEKYPGQNIVVIDLGTATTFDVINANQAYLGGVIIPGIYISMKALYENTAKLSPVNIIKPASILGKTTSANIQSGLYYSHLGAAREILAQIKRAAFPKQEITVIGTGGFAYLFEEENLFTALIPELVLHGLYTSVRKRHKDCKRSRTNRKRSPV